MVDNTTDGRVFINMTRIENNFGDGIWYRQKTGSNLLTHGIRTQRDLGVFAEEKPRADICRQHSLPSQYFFPHLLMARLRQWNALRSLESSILLDSYFIATASCVHVLAAVRECPEFEPSWNIHDESGRLRRNAGT
ncbi:hypothetical protein COOONC_25367 [Cooperia oncophora]